MSNPARTQVSLKLTNELDSPFVIAVEPWAHEFELPTGSTFELITRASGSEESLSLVFTSKLTTIWVNTGDVASATIDTTEVWP